MFYNLLRFNVEYTGLLLRQPYCVCTWLSHSHPTLSNIFDPLSFTPQHMSIYKSIFTLTPILLLCFTFSLWLDCVQISTASLHELSEAERRQHTASDNRSPHTHTVSSSSVSDTSLFPHLSHFLPPSIWQLVTCCCDVFFVSLCHYCHCHNIKEKNRMSHLTNSKATFLPREFVRNWFSPFHQIHAVVKQQLDIGHMKPRLLCTLFTLLTPTNDIGRMHKEKATDSSHTSTRRNIITFCYRAQAHTQAQTPQ